MDIDHFNQPQKRDATIIKPPNILKAKVGSGGLDESTLDRAQKILETNSADFIPAAENYLERMLSGIQTAQKIAINEQTDIEPLIANILYPCMQLKANGSMFHFPLVTRISERFVQFMEVIDTLDPEILDIALAFHKAISHSVHNNISGDTGKYGESLIEELNKACMRYFEKHKKL